MLKSSELAKAIGLSKNKVIELANAKQIPCIKLPSGQYRFDEQAVRDHLSQKVEAAQ